MKKNVLVISFFMCVCFSQIAFADGHGYTNGATPTAIDNAQSVGFMVYGDFGNPGGCTQIGAIWVSKNHPDYQILYSTALAAFMGGKKLKAYIHSCENVAWYVGPDLNYNALGAGGSFMIAN